MSARERSIISSALGGDGWIPRPGALHDERETIWSAFGVASECGRLRAVVMRRPGPEIEAVTDVRSALWLDLPDPARARDQHDALAALYRSYGVEVSYVTDTAQTRPNLYFMRDTFAMTPEGAILARPASGNRAGEERIAAWTLASLGIPIVLSVHGHGTFEGADLMIVNDDLALVAQGRRTNEAGARQIENLLREIGFGEIVRIPLPDDCLHLDCILSLPDRRLALLDGTKAPLITRETLRRHGFSILDVPDEQEAKSGMSLNLVALEPGLVAMPAHNPATRKLLEAAGVTCLEVEVSELMKGGGAVHCMTGVIQRDAL
jgi:N-dimethylarginine dimethylaminohydrolase